MAKLVEVTKASRGTYDYVVCDDAPTPHTKVVYREDVGDGTGETTVAVFFMSRHCDRIQCIELAEALSTNLND